ncbi:DUF3095 family protein [Patescibacteria group bacterium]|nr:DUF3095 family protein [Patescibacteria group bacterium]
MNDKVFYSKLQARHVSLQEILKNPSWFQDVPADWWVIVTDIQGSTKAMEAGRGKDIGTIAGSCVIACLNIAKQLKIDVPFFYGGDGATFIVPGACVEQMVAALKDLRMNVAKTYGLPLRVGAVQVQKIYDQGVQLRLAKWSVAPGYLQAVALGNGLPMADKLIKAERGDKGDDMPAMGKVDLEGLMCRWNAIDPKEPREEVVCVILEATEVAKQGEVYAKVIDLIDDIYGSYHDRHPVQKQMMTPAVSWPGIARREKLGSGRRLSLRMFDEAARAMMHAVIFRFGLRIGSFEPAEYLRQLMLATDTLHVGGTMHTIISGTAEQRRKLREALDTLEVDKEILYGLAACPSSVMTCYVQRLDEGGHMHFVDGAGGGYTLASREWKAKRVTK